MVDYRNLLSLNALCTDKNFLKEYIIIKQPALSTHDVIGAISVDDASF